VVVMVVVVVRQADRHLKQTQQGIERVVVVVLVLVILLVI
jgi:hypothetical protein